MAMVFQLRIKNSLKGRGEKHLEISKDYRGATSVLVVVIMLVLMMFGLAALTTAVAGRRLTDKNLSMTQEYYQLEGQAVKCHAKILSAIRRGGQEAIKKEIVDFQEVKKAIQLERRSGKDVWQIDYEVKGEEEKRIEVQLEIAFFEKTKEAHSITVLKWQQVSDAVFDEGDGIEFSDVQEDIINDKYD